MKTTGITLVSVLAIVAIVVLSSCNGDPIADAKERLAADIKAIDNHLAANQIIAYKDQSGIRFTINTLGFDGPTPRPGQTVKVNYTTKLLNGTIVEPSTTKTARLVDFPTTGLMEGIEILSQGTIATLYVPSGLGYGDTRINTIPENSILVYEVEFVEIVYSDTEKAQFTEDTVALNTYFTENSIDPDKFPFGISVVVHENGTGDNPFWYDKIRMTYKGRLLTESDTSFFYGTKEPTENFDCRVVDFLPGLAVGLQTFRAGSKATIYLPSGNGFGPVGITGEIPPDANLIFEIESVEILEHLDTTP